MSSRNLTALDRLIGEIDIAIKVLSTPALPSRASPADACATAELTLPQRLKSARLMRVNHSGEVAAQALYQGQALTARNAVLEQDLKRAAGEEMDHLAWCEGRLRELDGATSLLNPLWYAGSFAIGATAGALGDPLSLGFVVETENQVETHLRGHLDRLPPEDQRSRAILQQMTADEVAHAKHAADLGARPLPQPIRWAMRLTARGMTFSSHWL